MKRLICLVLCMLALSGGAVHAQQSVTIRAGKIIDDLGSARSNVVITVRGTRIEKTRRMSQEQPRHTTSGNTRSFPGWSTQMCTSTRISGPHRKRCRAWMWTSARSRRAP